MFPPRNRVHSNIELQTQRSLAQIPSIYIETRNSPIADKMNIVLTLIGP